jgi:hypothetical protein
MREDPMKSSHYQTLFALFVISFAILAGCGGGGGGTDNSGNLGPSSGDEAFDRRVAVSKAVSDLYDTLPHTDITAENQAILALLQSRPEIEAAGQVEPGSVWARYKDNGEMFVVVNDGSVTTADLTRAARTPFARGGAQARSPKELPSGQKLMLFNNMGANALLSVPHITGAAQNAVIWAAASFHMNSLKGLLEKSDGAHYTGVVNDSGTPFTLKTVQGADGLYMYGHAGFGIDKKGRTVFVLNTALPTFSVFSPLTLGTADVQTYKNLVPDIVAGRVGMMMVVDGAAGTLATPDRKLTMKAYYYITPDFVREYMSFKPNTSFVFVNGCNASDPALGSDWKAAFREKGASVYVSWDKHANAFEAFDTADAFFAGITGGKLGPIEMDPPQRPFPYTGIVQQLLQTARPGKSYSVGQTGGHEGVATLQAEELTPSSDPRFGLLTPTIEYLFVDEKTDTLQIVGVFGSRPTDAKVTINGSDLAVSDWQPDLVKCQIPRRGANSIGDVVVSANGHKSNPATLTAWEGDFHYTSAGGHQFVAWTTTPEFTVKSNLHVRFRADIRSRRVKAGAAPDPAQTGAGADGDSSFDWTGSGVHTNGDGSTDTLSGGGSGTFGPGASSTTGFGVSINMATKQVSVFFHVSKGAALQIKRGDSPPSSIPLSGGTVEAVPRGQSSIKTTITDDFTIKGQNVTFTTEATATTGGTYTTTIQWDDLHAVNPPKTDTARKARLR